MLVRNVGHLMTNPAMRWDGKEIPEGILDAVVTSAIGAQVANPDKTVLLIDGDGSFNMTLNDLGTVLENQLPLKMAIMNDHKQQMVVVWQKLFFDGRTVATNNVNPDFVALAQAYGIEAFKCDHTDDLPAAIDRFVNAKGPVLCDFRVVPDICLPMVAPGKGLDEMFLPGDISLDEDAALAKMEAVLCLSPEGKRVDSEGFSTLLYDALDEGLNPNSYAQDPLSSTLAWNQSYRLESYLNMYKDTDLSLIHISEPTRPY